MSISISACSREMMRSITWSAVLTDGCLTGVLAALATSAGEAVAAGADSGAEEVEGTAADAGAETGTTTVLCEFDATWANAAKENSSGINIHLEVRMTRSSFSSIS